MISPETQVALLLYAGLGQRQDRPSDILNLNEYNRLIQYIVSLDTKPSDLLQPDGLNLIKDFIDESISHSRLSRLLSRGAALALMVERWVNNGLWVIGRSEPCYPFRLKESLGAKRPPLVYGVGKKEILNTYQYALAIVGSRNVDENGRNYTAKVAGQCAKQGVVVVSGGAKGVDQTAMLSASDANGVAIGFLSDNLWSAAVSKSYRNAVAEGKVVLLSACEPEAAFTVGNAMGRNKYIYALADAALVVSCEFEKGGTWAGAAESLKKWKDKKVFVRIDDNSPQGNKELLSIGAIEFLAEPWDNIQEILRKTSIDPEVPEMKDGRALTPSPEQSDVRGILLKVLCKVLQKVPKSKDELKELLGLKDKQLDALLEIAISEGKIIKKKQLVYMIQESKTIDQEINVYNAIEPILLKSLTVPRSEKEISETLGIDSNQVKHWLKIAIENKKVKKDMKTKKYYLASKELTLFSEPLKK